jgi:hypothetical protein
MTVPIHKTEFWNDLCHGILGPRKGGARIIIDAEDAKTGAGKTGLAVYIARILSGIFGYDLQDDDLTLSGTKYLQRWREHPGADQPSVIILDELGGAGAGHARRAMSTQNVELGNAWQLMRKKRIISIVTLPHWSKVDRDMRMQADFRLWCLNQPIGYFNPYQVGASFDNGEVKTDGYDDVDRIAFPDMDSKDDGVYGSLATEKDDLLDSGYFDADKLQEGGEPESVDPDEARRQERIEIAQQMRDDGDTAREIAKAVDMSHTWVIDNTESPQAES